MYDITRRKNSFHLVTQTKGVTFLSYIHVMQTLWETHYYSCSYFTFISFVKHSCDTLKLYSVINFLLDAYKLLIRSFQNLN